MLSRSNQAPTVDQLLALARRAGGKPLRWAEVATLLSGIRALAAAAGSGAPAPAAPVTARASEAERLLDAAIRLYAGVYGLTREQALAEVRAEAGL